ncbi:Fe-S protein assembly chaperone HscA [Eoetvoesiella caeni]|uniref:Chaperone protein HscA homolog n=1 Tax=Eoetvoesiella caeni TaxID=645616 RepID=A0A366HG44_9BURK|nr:Fe-S protein assembly chaperone HscA [Eoetvoesiella caeni]MCI2808639.1 Fe-S protein assembly chaperone HscA [Eoetvoesiella caeni]NYT55180.1 Fe-S protein assembly chaperone HscA [Eoetvoesiella caeni]RBP40839.1 chaperone protein HscA [Eoetvoesiella caeni]
MALLQISEPGESPVPHQRKLAAGIDLGTTHSLVASVRNSVPEVLADEAGQGLLPSVVRYAADGAVQVGYEARRHQAQDSLNTIASVKRFMGRSLDEARAEGAVYEFADDAPVKLKTVQGEFTPVEISSRILAALRERAEGALGGELVGVVVTVPAYFDDAQRQATRDAARLAGLTVLRLLNEPTAAAIAYGLDHGAEGIYAVYDLGGGTFDLSILRLSQGVFEVAATGGDTQLGGDDFDAAIVAQIIQALKLDALDKGDQRALAVAARAAREALSASDSIVFEAQLSGLRRAALEIDRAQFEAWVQPLVQRTLDRAVRTLRDAGLTKQEVKGVVMVGGATRMPIIQREVGRLFGTTPLTDLDPDQVVALGAALQANLLVGNRAAGDDWLLLDVTPLSLGLETMGGIVERVIPRNSTIPVARAQEFTTFKDGQSAMSIHVVQGERELVDDCRSLARFELRGIPPMVAGAARIRVTFQVDADGLLNVGAREESTGVEASVAVKPSYGLTDDEVSRMLGEGMANAGSDAQARALREQQVELQQLVESIRAAMAADGDLLSEDEKTAITRGLRNAGVALSSDDAELARRAVQALSASSDGFAARRMDRSIRAALAGRNVDEIAR